MTKNIPADPIMLAGMTDCLAIAVENAVTEWGDTLDSFFEKFLVSGLADSFSEQAPFVTTGCTGEELVAKINEKITGRLQTVRSNSLTASYSEYYWIGYAFALLAAESGKSVREILAAIPPDEWRRMYPTHHEYGDELLLARLTETCENASNKMK